MSDSMDEEIPWSGGDRNFGSPEILVLLPRGPVFFHYPSRQRPFIVKISLFWPKNADFRASELPDIHEGLSYFRENFGFFFAENRRVAFISAPGILVLHFFPHFFVISVVEGRFFWELS